MAMIIKANETHPQAAGKAIRPVAFRFGDMAQQAAEYLEQVRQQAREIVRQAEAQAAAIRQRAAADGRQEALEAARQETGQQLAENLTTLMPALRTAVTEIDNAKQAWMNHWHQTAVKIAVAIAERIIRRQLDRQPEITLDLVREALELAAGSAEITVRLNPDDHANLGPQVAHLANELAQLGPAAIVSDPEISPGGCRIDTRFGAIDQQIESQLARIQQELA